MTPSWTGRRREAVLQPGGFVREASLRRPTRTVRRRRPGPRRTGRPRVRARRSPIVHAGLGLSRDRCGCGEIDGDAASAPPKALYDAEGGSSDVVLSRTSTAGFDQARSRRRLFWEAVGHRRSHLMKRLGNARLTRNHHHDESTRYGDADGEGVPIRSHWPASTCTAAAAASASNL